MGLLELSAIIGFSGLAMSIAIVMSIYLYKFSDKAE